MFILYFGIFHWNIIKQFSHVSGLRFLLILIFTPFNSVLPFFDLQNGLAELLFTLDRENDEQFLYF